MQHRDWRELAEVAGFVTIVAVLVMIALEQRTANRIAQRAAEFDAQHRIASLYADMYQARAGNPEVAKVFAKISSPQGHLITATDTSQIRAIAQQYINLYRFAQAAYDNGLLPQDRYEQMQADLQSAIERYPGLQPALVSLYESLSEPESLPILEPISRLAEDTAAGAAE